jgi:hypothetical protein
MVFAPEARHLRPEAEDEAEDEAEAWPCVQDATCRTGVER